MKAVSFIILLTFSINSFASPGNVQILENAIDTYEYALTVEWDQKDAKTYAQFTEAFAKDLSAITSTISAIEINEALRGRVSNPELLKQINQQVLTFDKVLTPGILFQAIQDHRSELYTKGASWNADTGWTIAEGALIASILGTIIYFAVTEGCAKYDYVPARHKRACVEVTHKSFF